jgi:hypothetical protein
VAYRDQLTALRERVASLEAELEVSRAEVSRQRRLLGRRSGEERLRDAEHRERDRELEKAKQLLGDARERLAREGGSVEIVSPAQAPETRRVGPKPSGVPLFFVLVILAGALYGISADGPERYAAMFASACLLWLTWHLLCGALRADDRYILLSHKGLEHGSLDGVRRFVWRDIDDVRVVELRYSNHVEIHSKRSGQWHALLDTWSEDGRTVASWIRDWCRYDAQLRAET